MWSHSKVVGHNFVVAVSLVSRSDGCYEGQLFVGHFVSQEGARSEGKNHGVVYLPGRCCTLSDEHRLLGCAVGTMAGPPAQGGIQILGGVPLFQLSNAIRLDPTGQCTFEERLRVDSVVSLTVILSVGCTSDVCVAILASRT